MGGDDFKDRNFITASVRYRAEFRTFSLDEISSTKFSRVKRNCYAAGCRIFRREGKRSRSSRIRRDRLATATRGRKQSRIRILNDVISVKTGIKGMQAKRCRPPGSNSLMALLPTCR